MSISFLIENNKKVDKIMGQKGTSKPFSVSCEDVSTSSVVIKQKPFIVWNRIPLEQKEF